MLPLPIALRLWIMLDITSYDYFIRYLATQADINEKKVTL